MERRNLIALGVVLAFIAGVTAIAQLVQHNAAPADDSSIGVFDVQLDRNQRAWVDITFDRPVSVAQAGRVVIPPPATIDPHVQGVWRWRTNNVLRFEPAGGFAPGAQFTITLNKSRFLAAGQRFRGDGELRVRIDDLIVRSIVTNEEVIDAARHIVVLQGDIYLNYDVNPELLVTRAELIDGNEHQPLEIASPPGCNADISFRSRPLQKRNSERTLKLVISKGLAGCIRGSVLQNDYVQEVKLGSSDKLVVRNVEGKSGTNESTLRIELSSAVAADVASKFVTVTPAVKYQLGVEGNDLQLIGAFTPGSAYHVVVAKGLPATDDATLEAGYAADVTFPDLAHSLDFQSEGMFLSASGWKNVAIESVNVDEAWVAVDRVYRNNIAFALTHQYDYRSYNYEYDEDADVDPNSDVSISGVSESLGDRLAYRRVPLRKAHNKKIVTTISLEPYVKKAEPGLYRVTVADAHHQSVRWILITDIGIVAKEGEDELIVWASSFKDLAPIDGAAVSLISTQNQTLATGRTDERGVFHLKGLTKILGKKKPLIITLQKGGDYSFLHFDKSQIDISPFDVAGDQLPAAGYFAFVYAERDIYRPGEVVEGVAVVRDRMLQPPPQMPLVAKHFDGSDERESTRLTIGDGGVAPFTIKLPPYARTGHHRLDVIAGTEVIGTYRFQVEEFVPDRIKVEIRPKTKAASPGDDLIYDVGSNYLFGPPAANLTVETRVRLMPVQFTPTGFESYAFANNDRKFESRELATESGALDAAGAKQFRFAIPAGLQVPSSLEALVVARVQEQGGRGVSAIAHVPVHPVPYYLGIRRGGDPDKYPDPGRAVTFEWVAVGHDEKPSPAGTLRAELMEDRWHCLLRRSSSGSYDYVTTRETRQVAVKSLAAGLTHGSFVFTPREYGSYRVVITDAATGASAEVEFYASGRGYSPWAMKNPGRLQLELDKDEYAPGDTAIVQVKAPFAGKLLITLERDRIHYISIETLAGNSAKISIPITADLRPNGYVTATLVRTAGDLEPGEAGRAFGAIPINVDRTANRVAPAIKAPAELRANRTLPIDVTAEPGAIVTIAAVDEGILQLIAQKTADPFSWFYRKLALGTSTYDIFAQLLPEVKPKGKAAAGGSESGEGQAQYVRADSIRRAKPVSYWSGPLKADANGRVHTEFAIPDFQGGIRVMAVVHRGRRFGSSEAMVRVHDPITLLPTVPRFLSVGDQVSIPITVRNDTGRAGRFSVELTGAVRQQLDLPNATEKTAYFTLTAPHQPGEIVFTATASGNGEKSSAKFDVPVRWDLPLETVEVAGPFTENAATFRPELVKPFVPGSVERTLVVSPLPIVRFRGKLKYLLHYPYGCVEQTTSSVFPLIYFSDLAKELDPDAFRNNESTAMVHEGIRRLATMQTYSGGFSMWPYGQNVYPWGSAYATHFLVEARRAGHPVDSPIYDRALAFIANDAKARSDYDELDLERVVYELYILARAGKPDLGTMDFLRAHHASDLHPEGRALLAAAYATVGNPVAIQTLLSGLHDVDDVARTTGNNLDSAIRNRAMLLLAILDASPNDARIAPLVERLARDAAQPYWTTQESAFALLALGQFIKHQKAMPPYSGAVFLDNRLIGTFENRTAVFRNIQGEGTIRVKMNGAYTSGAAFYSLDARGVKTAAAFKPESSGIRVTRELHTRDGSPIDPTGVTQGELLICTMKIESLNGRLDNVVVQNLIPAGLEVENPRLKTTEKLPWMTDGSECTNVDIRDDQVLYFVELPASGALTFYTLLRAVTPGVFQQQPLFAEAMYARANHAVGERGVFIVRKR
ncbi:MAG: hypothetical protein JWO97_3498 [Acidobacteria bacterium]|nr:hypothetical protein [Acidobacteriota bacterium]